MLSICFVESTFLYATICVEYLAAAAFDITVAPPFVIALMIVSSVSETLSRFGPISPTVPAAFSVWHTPQVLTNGFLPSFGFPTIFGAVADTEAVGRATASASAAMRRRDMLASMA